MVDKQVIGELIQAVQQATHHVRPDSKLAQRVMGLIDLTSLNEQDDDQAIASLCTKALTLYGPVAAVCVLPQWVKFAKQQLAATPIKIATVANFPQGEASLPEVLKQIETAVAEGADEVDVVAPYKMLQDNKDAIQAFLQACKQACHRAKLKVILETGALQNLDLIATLSQIALDAGADFIKTSTGKIAVGAQLDAAAAMLLTIKHNAKQTVGFKASGGIKTPEQAIAYLSLAELILGKDWISAEHFRFGASGLVDCLLNTSA